MSFPFVIEKIIFISYFSKNNISRNEFSSSLCLRSRELRGRALKSAEFKKESINEYLI